ncbi:MAG: hypothetical protein KTV68_14690 [Acidimicrobiia bacterium]|nr:hypothetical protein [Acidimicrobiia bacterium]
MSNDPWGTEADLFSGGEMLDSSGAGSDASKRRLRTPAVLLGIAAAVLALIALVATLDGSEGYAAVGVAAGGYLLAVLADFFARRTRHAKRNYRRPRVLVALRVLTFGLAIWVGWETASSLAGAA